MDNRRIAIIIGVVLVVGLVIIGCLVATGTGAFLLARGISQGNINIDSATSTTSAQNGGPTPEVVRPAEIPTNETLNELINTIVPENDPVDLAERLRGISNIPDTYTPPKSRYVVGDRRSFWLLDNNTDQSFQSEAVLRYVSDHLYFWVEDGVSYDQDLLVKLANAFENDMLPTERDFFGSEWSPGIDNDPHIYILYARGIGYQVAGYFSSRDEVNPLAEPYSNAAEMFVFNADNSPLDDEYTYGVLAHEYQHMIHWYRDRNETSWVNEGLSELATLLTGYFHAGFAAMYTAQPDLQLNDWPEDDSATPPHYGAGFMYVTYFLSRFGSEATQALVADPANGLDGVDHVLEDIGYTDSIRGRAINGDDTVLDWVIANYLMDSRVADGRFDYGEYSGDFAPAHATETISDCSSGGVSRDVHQFGVDYIDITCPGSHTLHFEGSTAIPLLPQSPHSGDYAFWSNKGDESDMTLTQTFDLSDVTGSVTLDYWTWYNIEEDWDYVYVLASTDGGATWSFLRPPSGRTTNPTGNNYDIGLTGSSGGDAPGIWINEDIDLSEFAGQSLTLRFEYVTDAAVNGEGMLLDDVSIPEIGYSTDFETDNGGWEAAGWARVQNVLPQQFKLALISEGDQTTVDYLDLSADNSVDVPFEIGNGVDRVTLVVMGSTRFTRQEATYRYEFQP